MALLAALSALNLYEAEVITTPYTWGGSMAGVGAGASASILTTMGRPASAPSGAPRLAGSRSLAPAGRGVFVGLPARSSLSSQASVERSRGGTNRDQ